MDDPVQSRGPIYLARASYRQRRLRDVARVLPIVGIVLWILPVIATAEYTTSRSGLYLFAVWMLLIFAAAFVARRLREDPEDGESRHSSADENTP